MIYCKVDVHEDPYTPFLFFQWPLLLAAPLPSGERFAFQRAFTSTTLLSPLSCGYCRFFLLSLHRPGCLRFAAHILPDHFTSTTEYQCEFGTAGAKAKHTVSVHLMQWYSSWESFWSMLYFYSFVRHFSFLLLCYSPLLFARAHLARD